MPLITSARTLPKTHNSSATVSHSTSSNEPVSSLELAAPQLFVKRKPTFHDNVLVDALVLVSIPIAIQLLLAPGTTKQIYYFAKRAILGDENAGFVVREIKAATMYDKWEVVDQQRNANNQLLQKAIALYIAELLDLKADDALCNLVEKPLELRERRQEQLEDEEENSKNKVRDDDYGDDFYNSGCKSDALDSNELCNWHVSAMPCPKAWVEVQPGIFFQYESRNKSQEDDNDNDFGYSDHINHVSDFKRVVTTFRFKTKLPRGTKKIDRFIHRAFLKYQKMQLLRNAKDTGRYMYVQQLQLNNTNGLGNGNSPKDAPVKYRRYALGEEKTFDNLFFDEKDLLVQLLDNFMQRSGKFAIKGFPYKLGLLLHGPPGTGKTSLIKAVAQYTKRHIVTISLGKIKTNQELMDAVMDLKFPIQGKDLPVKMRFDQVVFVMEDIDCASSVVLSRDHLAIEDSNKSDTTKKSKSSSSATRDKLNLSGLLNVLDGVIDCPGRIIIMTTNHPEKLDPALIRPGRVNKKLFLGYMSDLQIEKMVSHYFGTTRLTTQLREKMKSKCAVKRQVTPAQVEEYCIECATVNDVIERLICSN